MRCRNASNKEASELRQRAEAVVRQEPVQEEAARVPSRQESSASLRELHLCNVELELQSGDLQRTRAELETCRGGYPGISDDAQVGYCTLSEQGTILECNHAFAVSLGESRDSLIDQQFTHFICEDDQGSYYLNRKEFLEAGASDACELRMLRKGEGTFRVHLKAAAAQDSAGRQVSLVAVTSMVPLGQTTRDGPNLQAHPGLGHGGAPGSGLSGREREVLCLVGRGLKSREIAEALGISSRTVDSHRQKIMQKLEISNAAGLVKFAIEHGLEPPPKK